MLGGGGGANNWSKNAFENKLHYSHFSFKTS